jgi:serine/threonine-protein kinase
MTAPKDTTTRDDATQWREAKRIFDRLVHLPAARRDERLERMQVDPVVRERIAALAAAQARSDGLLDAPLPFVAGATSLAGREFGQWQLEAELGRGGSAVVYRARSLDGERVAAVKLLTMGSLARSGSERFRREQRILARLNHAHIVQLFDAGVAADGTSWLAMALVHGEPIDAWCRARSLDARAIVALVLRACEAVAYAHRNLVVHRDIKPSNVLVDEHGHVRLLDFGIARLVEDEAAPTETQWRLLTPQYAAPEQFTGAPPSTAMDVYGLGALLYRLLGGCAPRSAMPGGDSMPVPPSRAAARHDPPLPAPSPRAIAGDLDRIVLKALATRPEDRYSSVPELAADLQRWLAGAPVSATRPSLAYRARKFVSRHRFGVAAAAAVFVALVAGVAATTWQAQRARAEAQRATAVKSFVTSIFSEAGPAAPRGPVTDVRAALARGADRARTELAATPDVQAELLLLIGSLQSSFGEYANARRQLDDGLALTQQPTAAWLRGQLLAELGRLDVRENRFAEGIASIDAALALGPAMPEAWQMDAWFTRAAALQFLGRMDEAFADLDRAEAIEAKLPPGDVRRREQLLVFRAQFLANAGRFREAGVVLARAHSMLKDDQPIDFVLHQMRGSVADQTGDWHIAEQEYLRAVQLVREGYPPDSPVLAQPYSYYATWLRRTGRLVEAEALARDALAAQEKSLPPGSPALGTNTSNVGVVLRDLGRFDEALPYFRRASLMADRVYGVDSPGAARLLAHESLALAQSGRQGEARQVIGAAVARLARAEAAGMQQGALFVSDYAILAHAALALGDAPQALAFLDAADRWEAAGQTSGLAALVRAAMRVRLEAEAGATPGLHDRIVALAGRLSLLPAEPVFFERAEAAALLARAAAARGDFALAARLTASATPAPGVSYPRFVLDALD